MYISNPQRVKKLAAFLWRNPASLPRYFRYHRLLGRQPLDLGLPWWSFGAIDFVGKRLTSSHRVFEFGTGGSTVFFSRRCREVACVENDAAWLALVRSRLRQLDLANVSIQTASLDFTHERDVYGSDFLAALQGRHDVIVVDGQDYGGRGVGKLIRPACFARAEEHVAPGGMIVVDDSWRLTELRDRNRAKAVHVFEGVGPCRVGVTSTDVYLY